jgi:HAE1 family hydrophobic/amphiphilic exporter-1
MQVRNALRQQNRDISAGDLWEGKRRYVIRTLGRFRSPEQVGDVIVAQSNASPVYLRDVAEVRRGFKKPTGRVKNFGTTCLAINCVRETGANVLETMAGLKQAVDELNRDVLEPRKLELIQTYDETDYIYSAINLVRQNILVGGLLTIAVLLLFLRSGRSTLVIALAIPTSIIGTFLMLNLMGRSLNVISLAGLAFAVGMLVDNAVVVLENVYRHHQSGDDSFAASVRGAKEVWGAVVASTLTTLAVFLPVLFVEEEAGQLFRDIALAISSAVGLSLIVSITVIPTSAARLLRKRGRGRSADDERDDASDLSEHAMPQRQASRRDTPLDGAWDRHPRGSARLRPARRGARRVRPLAGLVGLADLVGQRFVNHVVGVNAFLQRSVLLRVATVAGLVVLALGLSYLMMPPVEYLPSGNRNLVFGQLLPPPGYNLEQLLELGTTLENRTERYWNIDPEDPEIENLDYPAISDFFFVASDRRVFFGLRAVDPLRAGELVPLIQGLATELPGTIAFAGQTSLFSRDLTGARSVDVEITGPEISELVGLGRRIFGEVLRVMPGARPFPQPSLDLSSPEIHVLRKPNQASDVGVTNDELGYTVDALIDGAYATDYYIGGDKIDLTIVGNEQFAERTQDLAQLPVATPSGQLVGLEGLARVQLSGGPEQINRRERRRSVTIQVTPPPEVPLEQAIDTITTEIVGPLRAQGAIPPDYQIRLAGTADKLRATWKALRWNVVLALVITYLLMAALFESWLYPLVIIFSVPLGAVGGFFGLWLLNVFLGLTTGGKTVQSLDVLTMLGFVILIGTVVNNAILIVHQSLNHMRDEGMPQREAILASVRNRIRPIFMTTSTTIFGLLPLVLFPGAGSELYRGLGAVVLGGLLVSTFFTLVLVPTLFSLMMEAKAWLLSRFRPTTEPAISPEPCPAEEPVAAR